MNQLETYWKHVDNLPEALQEIHHMLWDETGRPKHDASYEVAVGLLCALSDDWDQFKSLYKQFFFNKEREHNMSLAWHCYMKGMHVLADKMIKKA